MNKLWLKLEASMDMAKLLSYLCWVCCIVWSYDGMDRIMVVRRSIKVGFW